MIGAAATVAAGSQPGILLGGCLVAGTLAAALTVQARAVYLLIPVPALAYPVAAVAAGLAGGRAAGTSHTALAIGAAQWVADGFIAMAAATILAIGITAARWPRQDSGGPRQLRYRPPAGGSGGPRRADDVHSTHRAGEIRSPRRSGDVRSPRRAADPGRPAARRRPPGDSGYPLAAS